MTKGVVTPEPLFSVISPVYNVARYLDEYFASLEAQTVGLNRLEIILIDDGSADDSLAKCREFAARHPDSVQVLHQANAGQASARNAGLAVATAPWITFPDPDDVLSDNYFADVDAYMRRPESAETVLFAGHLISWNEKSGEYSDSHPTSFRFALGNSTTDLNGKPNFIHGNAPVSFFRRDIIAAHDLEFPKELRTRFEDTKLLFDYLLSAEKPVLGLIDSAHYYYPRRADSSSTLQRSAADERSYRDLPTFGYLPVLRRAKQNRNIVPRWLQWFLIYDLIWLMRDNTGNREAARTVDPDILSAFHQSISEVMTYIEPESVQAFDMMAVPQWMREALAHGYSPRPWTGAVQVSGVDTVQGLIQLRYRYTHDLPRERIIIRGQEVEAHFAKSRPITFLGRTLLQERTLWVSSRGVLRLELNNRIQQITTSEHQRNPAKVRAIDIDKYLKQREDRVPPRFRQQQSRLLSRLRNRWHTFTSNARRSTRLQELSDGFLAVMLRLPPVRRAYAGAWVFMDRDRVANDNAEHLYRWVRDNKPGTKIYFVLRRRTPDWDRLESEGFRLVEFGSYRWKILLLLARHMLSSHADRYVTNPLPARYGPPQWNFTFLQHGITKGDISTWLNTKGIDVFVCGMQEEYTYIAGDSPYRFSAKEAQLTGFPRHDALLKKSLVTPPADVSWLVLTPTWRDYIMGTLNSESSRSRKNTFLSSAFAQQWQAILTSETLKERADQHGLQMVFLPHPNIQPYVDQFTIPPWIETKQYGDVDVQEVLCRAAVMVTDYSSIAFEMAFLHRPVIYFHFDYEEYRNHHIEGEGYFSYERDGFGPVVTEAGEVPQALEKLWSDEELLEMYLKRARNSFPVRDGNNSARVYRAVKNLEKPISFARASRRAPTTNWE